MSSFLKDKVSLFRDISTERLQPLVEGSRVGSFEASEAIMHQGAEATHFGVVLSGTVHASVLGDGGTRQSLGRLKAGDTFNEMALMTGDAVLADFIAESRCEVLLIPVSLFQSVIVAEPGAVQHISRTIAERMKAIMADPPKAAAALRQGDDPYGLQAEGRATREDSRHQLRLLVAQIQLLRHGRRIPPRPRPGRAHRHRRHAARASRAEGRGETRVAARAASPRRSRPWSAELTAKETGVIGGAGEVSVVAHRVVHGGEKFTEGTLITDEVLAQIEALNPLAPLHNPVNVAGIREMRRLFPAVPHVAVFDTAFHHTLPAYAYLYGLPYELYEKKGVRRYGFHGTSHHYVSLRAAQFLKRRPNELRLVSCHLGNGSSLCAVDHGRSVDTTMGFTPAEGLIMGTRCGDVDAGVLAFLERTERLTATQSEEMLNKKSGLLGLSGISSDMREVLKAADEGQPRALARAQGVLLPRAEIHRRLRRRRWAGWTR